MRSCSGFDSLTATHDLARWCHDNFACQGNISAIMHLGDHDQTGISIFESVRDDVRITFKKDVPVLLIGGMGAKDWVPVSERPALFRAVERDICTPYVLLIRTRNGGMKWAAKSDICTTWDS